MKKEHSSPDPMVVSLGCVNKFIFSIMYYFVGKTIVLLHRPVGRTSHKYRRGHRLE